MSLVCLGVSMGGGVPLVSAKVFGLFYFQEISFSFRGFFPSLFFYFCFMDLKLTPSYSLIFFYLHVEWQEVTKRFRPVRLGVGGVPLEKRLLQEV